jgi:EAL domain-containing protein (putative c-di-GMP-specific phosphodiesterase class I)
VVYDPRDDTSAPHRMMLLGELRRALVGGELELHHQPIVAAATGNISATEGLLVWRHPSLGLLSADELTEMVELSNLHADIVVHSLREAVRHHQMWRDAGFHVPVSINVNGAAVHDAALVDRIVRIVDEADVPLHAIGLELDEQQLRLGRGIGSNSLRRLSDAGLRVTIDHFGGGRTPFSLLAPSGAHGVKLDRRAISELMPVDDALLTALRTGIQRLGLVIAADGADDENTYRWLIDHGADHVQGAFVGPTMDVHRVLEFLTSRSVPVAR